MSDENKTTGPTGKIEFIENHRPALPSGDYEITVSQSIAAAKPPLPPSTGQDSTAKKEKALATETFESQTRKFSVQGPRFTLEPQVIRTVFPPAGSLGEHSSVLPHISFHRSTLPWERFAIPLNEAERHAVETRAEERTKDQKMLADTPKLKTPWLALLLFDQDELEVRQDLKKIKGIGQKFEEKLNQQGIFTYQKIAELTPEAVKHLETEIIRFPGRITREKWVEKARELCNNKDIEQQKVRAEVSKPKACLLEKDASGKYWELKPGANASPPNGLLSPWFNFESGQQDGDPVTVIDVARDLLEDILPSKPDVQLLGHVRQPTDDSRTPVGDQVATLIANRLPRPGHMSVVHLVSLEGIYGPKKSDIWHLPADAAFVRLVSLRSWRFTCLDEKHSFKGLLHHLNKEHLFSIDQSLAQLLPGTIDEAPLPEDVRAAFVNHMSLAREAKIGKLPASWAITDKQGVRYDICKETAALKVFSNLDPVDVSIDYLEDALQKSKASVRVPEEIRSAFDKAKKTLSDKALLHAQADAWQVTDGSGKQYVIRKEGSEFNVLRNEKHLFRLTAKLGEALPDNSEHAILVSESVRDDFDHHLSVSKETTAGLERDAWIIEDKEQHQRYLIRREKAEHLGVYKNQELLFELNIAFLSKLPGSEKEQAIAKEIRNKFSSLKPLSDEAKIRKEKNDNAEAWRINDPDGTEYSIRREKTDCLGVYENQKLLFEFDFPGSEDKQTIEQAIEKEVVSQFSTLKPLVELSPGAKIRKEPSEAWRVTDPAPHGSDYMIRKNGSKYEVHRSMPHTLRLPTNHLKHARKFVEQGCVPMPHEMRQGNRSVSWYRGPLAPGRVDKADESAAIAKADSTNGDKQNASEGSFRARSADQLVRYNPAIGMFDVSYAAAWELGRLLTLQNEKVAVSLLEWKRRHRHAQERLTAMQALEHLPVAGRPVATDLPADVTRWFADLALLRGVPFNYLVPDERMLPQESIRFFWVDPDWIRCLHDGAFTIGRVLPSDHKRDAAHHPNLLGKPHAMVTGFLLRSEVVSGWPDLQIDGYDEAVPHENYEHETQAPKDPINERIPFDRWLQETMNNGDASALVSEFGFPKGSRIEVSRIVADSRWLVNVNENETLYRVEKTKDGFRLSIENKLPLLRMERLSPNVLLCMFAGDIKTVDIHQKPEALHFGLNRSGEGAPMGYYRELKSHSGGELPGCEVEKMPWRNGEESGKDQRENFKGVISIKVFNGDIQKKLKEFGGIDTTPSEWVPSDQLRKVAKNSVGEKEANIDDFVDKFKEAAESATSAQFALQMTEGVQKVRFVVGK